MNKVKYFVNNLEVTKLEFDTALNEEISSMVDFLSEIYDKNVISKDEMNDRLYLKAQTQFKQGECFALCGTIFKVEK